jgi:hypothetical protein
MEFGRPLAAELKVQGAGAQAGLAQALLEELLEVLSRS